MPADRLMDFQRGERELGKPLGKVLRHWIDVVGRAVVEQVPDDLHPDLFRCLERGQPARPVIAFRRGSDQVPPEAVADRADSIDDMAGRVLLVDVALGAGSKRALGVKRVGVHGADQQPGLLVSRLDPLDQVDSAA